MIESETKRTSSKKRQKNILNTFGERATSAPGTTNVNVDAAFVELEQHLGQSGGSKDGVRRTVLGRVLDARFVDLNAAAAAAAPTAHVFSDFFLGLVGGHESLFHTLNARRESSQDDFLNLYTREYQLKEIRLTAYSTVNLPTGRHEATSFILHFTRGK
jgi:hypothetical protein